MRRYLLIIALIGCGYLGPAQTLQETKDYILNYCRSSLEYIDIKEPEPSNAMAPIDYNDGSKAYFYLKNPEVTLKNEDLIIECSLAKRTWVSRTGNVVYETTNDKVRLTIPLNQLLKEECKIELQNWVILVTKTNVIEAYYYASPNKSERAFKVELAFTRNDRDYEKERILKAFIYYCKLTGGCTDLFEK